MDSLYKRIQAERDTQEVLSAREGATCRAVEVKGEEKRFSAIPRPESKGQPEPPTFKAIG